MRLSAYIFASIRENRGKYIVSILGIMVAIGTFFSLVLYAEQFSSTFDTFYGMHENTLFVMDENIEMSKLVPVTSRINESISTDIDDLPGVIATVNVLFADLSNFTESQFIMDRIYAFDQSDFTFVTQNMALSEGNWPDNPFEIVVGPDTFDRENSVGDVIDIKGTSFNISGILDFSNMVFNHFIYMDYNEAQTILSLENICSLIYVIYDNSINPIQLKESIETQHPVIAMDMNDLNVYLGGIYNIIELAQFVVGLLPLLISSIFFFVLITYIVRTRYREYALLKTIGFSEGQLITFLFIEVMIITLIGYILGALLGYFFYTISFQYVTDSAIFQLTFESWEYYWTAVFTGKYNFGITLLLLTGLNLVSTSIPALKIRRKSIVEVIRS